jgi:hypothetical protein
MVRLLLLNNRFFRSVLCHFEKVFNSLMMFTFLVFIVEYLDLQTNFHRSHCWQNPRKAFPFISYHEDINFCCRFEKNDQSYIYI